MPGNGANAKWRLWTGVIAVFAAGVIVGGLSTTALIRGHYLRVMRSGPPSGVHKPIAERLTEDLGLTGVQRAEVDSIVSDFEPRFKEFESRTRVPGHGVPSCPRRSRVPDMDHGPRRAIRE